MATLILDPGGEHYFGQGVSAWWTSNSGFSCVNNGPVGATAASDGKIYALQAGFTGSYVQKTFASSYGAMTAGYRAIWDNLGFGTQSLIQFSNSGSQQCDVRTADSVGHVVITRNGTVISPVSTQLLPAGWNYYELVVTFATTSTGTAKFYVNGVLWLSVTGVQTATTVATANQVLFVKTCNTTGGNSQFKDFYVTDGVTGPFGDVAVRVNYPTSAGVNQRFVQYPNVFSLTQAAYSAGSVTYTGTITGGASNAFAGYDMQITGFATAGNNGIFRCTASTATTLVCTNAGGVNEGPLVVPAVAGASYFPLTAAAAGSGGSVVYTGTFPAAAASNGWAGKNIAISGFSTGSNNGTFVCTASSITSLTLTNPATGNAQSGVVATANIKVFVQDGITHLGTWPDDDTTYIADSNVGDISDFAHEQLSAPGVIVSVIHVSRMKKDDAGGRSVAQVCLSGATTEVGTTISLGNSYLYYMDILDTDPNTGSGWTLSGYNNATFGAKDIT